MARRRSGYITVSVGDFIEEVCDEDLLAEVRRRKLDFAASEAEADACAEAYQWLVRGHPDEAKLCLERALYPRWNSQELCRKAYQQARLERP